MQSAEVSHALNRWPELAEVVFIPHTEAEYEKLVAILDRVIDDVGENESHPLASLAEILGVLVERYEDEHVPEIDE